MQREPQRGWTESRHLSRSGGLLSQLEDGMYHVVHAGTARLTNVSQTGNVHYSSPLDLLWTGLVRFSSMSSGTTLSIEALSCQPHDSSSA